MLIFNAKHWLSSEIMELHASAAPVLDAQVHYLCDFVLKLRQKQVYVFQPQTAIVWYPTPSFIINQRMQKELHYISKHTSHSIEHISVLYQGYVLSHNQPHIEETNQTCNNLPPGANAAARNELERKMMPVNFILDVAIAVCLSGRVSRRVEYDKLLDIAAGLMESKHKVPNQRDDRCLPTWWMKCTIWLLLQLKAMIVSFV